MNWRDRRLVLGAILVLSAALVGARLLGDADQGTRVWVARSDLAAGLALRADDLVAAEVRLGDHAARYASADVPPPPGAVTIRSLARGELVPLAAVGTGGAQRRDERVVTVPVDRFHLPADLARGDRVDVHVTARGSGQQGVAGSSRLLASRVVVVDVDGDGGRFGGGSVRGVGVAVPVELVGRVVGGIGSGTVDLVRVPAGER